MVMVPPLGGKETEAPLNPGVKHPSSRRSHGKLARMDVETRYADTGAGSVAYQVFGEGSIDMLLCPNWITHLEGQWEIPTIASYLNRLGSFGRVIMYDQRGTGMSDPVPLDALPTLEERMDDARIVLDEVGIERAAILGYEWGGHLAALFAATYPDRATALVLANTFVRATAADDFPWGMPKEMVQPFLAFAARTWGKVDPEIESTESLAERERWARYQRQTASPGVVRAMTSMLFETDIRPVLPAIRVPTLVIVDPTRPLIGLTPEEQRQIYMGQANYIIDQVPGARLVETATEVQASGNLGTYVPATREFLTGMPEMEESDRVLCTLLFTDIVSSTQTAVAMGDRRWRELLDEHDRLFRLTLQRQRGKEVNTTGDGFVATFDGPARAIRCAKTLVETARGLGFEIRAGVHTGECELRGDDVGGIAVHVAARVMSEAVASEVLVSGTVKDLVAGSGIMFDDRGFHMLKGLDEKYQLFAVTEVRARG
jgi:class 3 adenylate cyclase/pimeloyl-ACP methyl ester carboxylesterase